MLKPNNDNRSFFITSTGTELGKTYCAVEIIKALKNKKIIVKPYKPILSGFEKKNINNSDSYKILSTIQRSVNYNDIRGITPWCFKEPIAPSLAAKKEKKPLEYSKVLNWCLEKKNMKEDFRAIKIFEGAGGLFVPIEGKKTIIDLIKNLNIPIVLIVGNYLGSVSHTLSAIKNIQYLKINLINIIINQNNDDQINIDDTESLIRQSTNDKILIRKVYKNNRFNEHVFHIIINDILNFFRINS